MSTRASRAHRAVLHLFLIAYCCAGGWAQEAPGEGERRRPNIVFLYGDDHSERAISCYGSRMNRTPHIDRLATSGVRFTQSFVANSICGPARATVLTGLHSQANGKLTNGGGFKDELPTFAKELQAAGYRTAMVGKWHISSPPSGFDHWRWAQGTYYGTTFRTPEGKLQKQGYCTDLITEEALRWMAEVHAEAQPFMIWISHKAAHRTWEPAPDTLHHYEGVELPEPPTLFDDYAGRVAAAGAQMRIARDLFPAYDLKLPITGEGILDKAAERNLSRLRPDERKAWDAAYGPRNAEFAKANLEGEDLVRWKYQRYIKDYLRCVDALDTNVGRVLDWLDAKGLAENTIVIYASDQGFFLGEHGWYDKRWMYEPSLRTPLIVRWPGVTEAGTTCDAMVQNIDMAPTLMAMAGLEPLESMHGADLTPWLSGQEPSDWREAIYYHYAQRDSGRTSHTVEPHKGVRDRRYKLIHFYEMDEWELYDLAQDPEEMNNLAGDPKYGGIRQRLGESMRKLQEAMGLGG